MKMTIQVLILIALSLGSIILASGQESPDGFLDQYQISKEKSQKALKEYRDAKGSYLEEKNRNGSDNGYKRFVTGKNFLIKSNEVMINRLEHIIARTESTEGLKGDKKKELKLQLYGNIEFLNGKNIEMGRANGHGDVPGGGTEIKSKWKEIKIDVRAQKMEKEGSDTTHLIELKDSYDQKLSQAKDSNELAKMKFSEIEKNESEKYFKEGMALVIEARGYLGDAHKELKLIRIELARLSGKENPYGNAAL